MANFYLPQEKPLPPYLRTILEQCKRFPCLQNLSQFYISSLPLRHYCRLKCLEFSASTETPLVRTLNLESLTYILHNTDGQSEGVLGRILIVEDLTPDIIELLGSALQIDPLFFATHLHSARAEKTANQPDVRLLPSKQTQSNFTSTIYHHPLTFSTNHGPSGMLCDSNVRRKGGTLPLSDGLSVGLMQRFFSALLCSRESLPWLGVMLVDPPIRDSFFIDERGKQRSNTPVVILSTPFQGGYDDFMHSKPPPDKNTKVPYGPPRTSLSDDIIHYWTKEVPSNFSPRTPTPLSLSYYPLKIIVAEWMNFANLVHYIIENMEYSVQHLTLNASKIQGLEDNLRNLQSWRRRILESIYKMRSLATLIQSLRTGTDTHTSEAWNSLLGDIEHVVCKIDMFGRRIDAVCSVFTSFVQLLESRRSFAEAKSVTRLTYLALIFLPLSFVSGVFSMGGNFAPGEKWFWVYFTVGIPLMAAVVFVARR